MTIQRAREILNNKARNWSDDEVADYMRRANIQLDVLFDILLTGNKPLSKIN